MSRGACCVIVQRGRRISAPGATVIEVEDTVRAYGAIARFHRMRFQIPVIGITGSNGKTTTKDMLAHILSARGSVLKTEGTQNNHIGVPATLLRMGKSHMYAVIELGTNHPGELAYLSEICQPTMAVITNIGPSHLEYFNDIEGVYREKTSILRKGNDGPCIAILNADDNMLARILTQRSSMPPCIGYGINTPCDFRARNVRSDGRGLRFVMHRGCVIRLNTPGMCNIYNALAAIAASRVLGVPYSVISGRFKNFVFPQGRLTLRSERGIRFIDDTYNANPRSMEEAMKVLHTFPVAKGRRVLVMGDMLELGKHARHFHRSAGAIAAESCDIFITVGRHSIAAATAALTQGFDKTRVFPCKNAAEAREILYKTITVTKNDIVLLKGSRGMKLEKLSNPHNN